MSEAAAAGSRRAAVRFVLITVFLDVIGMGLVMPIWPQLVQGFVGGSTVKAAPVLGVFSTVYMAMQFVCSPLLGALADRFGRRRVILISVFGMGIDYIVMALAPSLAWLFVGRIASGAASATFSTAYAYVADVTPPEKRAAAFGLVGAAYGVGFIMGPLLGGFLGQFGARLPFWGAAGLALASGLYGLFVLPESLAPENRGRFSFARANPLGALELLRRHRELLGLASVNFLTQLANCVFNSVWVLYVIRLTSGWVRATVNTALNRPGPIRAATPETLALAPCSRPCSSAPTLRDIRLWDEGPAKPQRQRTGIASRNSHPLPARPQRHWPVPPRNRPSINARRSPSLATTRLVRPIWTAATESPATASETPTCRDDQP